MRDTDTESFIILVKTKDVYENIAGDVEKTFETSSIKSVEYYLGAKLKKYLG